MNTTLGLIDIFKENHLNKSILFLLLILPIAASAQVVHLDCTGVITSSTYDEYPVGAVKGPYLIDVDLDGETGKIGGWSSTTYSTNANDPSKILEIGEETIRFGPSSGGPMTMIIRRTDLKFLMIVSGRFISYSAEGECVLVDDRKVPDRAF